MLVSIVTIVYNSEREIEETIKSVLSQNYRPIEYIIIDGGSRDNTINIVNKFIEDIDHFVSEPDNGIFDAINKGVRCATGNLVGLIHSGDSYEPDAIKIAAEAFIETNSDIIYGDMFSSEVYNSRIITKHHRANHLKLKNNMSIFHPSTFIKRKCYQEHGLYDTKYLLASDYDYLLKLFLLGKQFYYIDKPLATFSAGGLSGSNILLSIKDNYYIRKQNLNILFALRYMINQIFSYCFFNFRKKLLESLIGENNYAKLKAKKFAK